MHIDELKNVVSEIMSDFQNLKAETIVNEVQQNSDNPIDFLIQNKSSFSRSYRRDILNVKRLRDEEVLLLSLSRNGLYDSLPEGVFHEEIGSKEQNNYAENRKKYKKEEEEARAFFSPIENEFFHQRLHIEKNERGQLDNFYNLKDDFLIDFWKIDESIPRDFILKLIKLLPYAYKLAGNLELTRLSLEKILGEKISFKKKYTNTTSTELSEDIKLGVNFVTQAKESSVYHPFLEVVIGPVCESRIDTYLNEDEALKFINVFYDYFMPLELDVVTEFVVNKKEGFVLNEEQGPIIGVSTKI